MLSFRCLWSHARRAKYTNVSLCDINFKGRFLDILRYLSFYLLGFGVSLVEGRLQFAGKLDCDRLNSRPCSFYPCKSLADCHAFGVLAQCGAVLHLVFFLVTILKKQVFAKGAGGLPKFVEFRLDLETFQLVFIFHFGHWMSLIGVSRRVRNRKHHVLSEHW